MIAAEPVHQPSEAAGLTIWQRRIRVFLATGALLVLAWAAVAIDAPVSRWCVEGRFAEPLRDFLDEIEPFGNGFAVPVILAAVWFLDRARRRVLPRLLACAYLPGLMANLVKVTVVRTRPYAFDLKAEAAASFGGWFPLASADSAGQSFPSAHTATAVGLAVGLAWVYPRARTFFAALAVLVACQRVASGFHFPSDVLFGGALGLLIAASCTHIGVLRRLFNRIERRPTTGTSWDAVSLRPAPLLDRIEQDPATARPLAVYRSNESADPAPDESYETQIIRRLLSRAA